MSYLDYSDQPKYAEPLYAFPKYSVLGIEPGMLNLFIKVVSEVSFTLGLTSDVNKGVLSIASEINKGSLILTSKIKD